MYRLTQIIRNSFIRLEGLLYQFFGFFSKLFGQLFNFFSRLFGFTESQYFLENDVQGVKPDKNEPDTAAGTPQNSPPAASNTRRRPDASMDYFLKLAQPKKASR